MDNPLDILSFVIFYNYYLNVYSVFHYYLVSRNKFTQNPHFEIEREKEFRYNKCKYTSRQFLWWRIALPSKSSGGAVAFGCWRFSHNGHCAVGLLHEATRSEYKCFTCTHCSNLDTNSNPCCSKKVLQ